MADLLAMLGSAGNMAESANNNRNRSNSNSTQPKPLVTLKAGNMTTTKLDDNGKIQVKPELERGQIEISQLPNANANNSNGLQFVWRNRRTKEVAQEFILMEGDGVTFKQVYPNQRVYVLQFGDDMHDVSSSLATCIDKSIATSEGEAKVEDNAAASAVETTANTNTSSSSVQRYFYWLQDINTESDLELTRKIAKYVSNPIGSTGRSVVANNAGSSEVPTSTTATDSATTAVTGPGDALSSILDNLTSTSTSSSNDNVIGTVNSTTGAGTGTGTGQLTLADLQGAMAGLATSSPTPATAVASAPLTEVASADNVREFGILDDSSVKEKLIQLLPEGQQNEESLMENLNSPQVRSALSSLTSALVTSPDSFHSMIMNFQLRPEDASLSSNPIQAFLECLLAQVEREKQADNGTNEEKNDDN